MLPADVVIGSLRRRRLASSNLCPRGLPCRLTVSHRCRSVKKRITFGRTRVKLVWISSLVLLVIRIDVCEPYLLLTSIAERVILSGRTLGQLSGFYRDGFYRDVALL